MVAQNQTARAGGPSDPSQAEYDAIYATMMASTRGRWFLTEYARRNRSADTTAVLAAIDQIGAHLRGEALPPDAPEYLHLGLMAMAGLVAAVEADIAALSTGHETEAGAKPRVTRVVSTLRDLGDCIQVMLDGFKTPATTAEAPATRAPVAPLTLVETTQAAPTAGAMDVEQSVLPTPEPIETSIVETVVEYESDFVPFELDVPEEMTATANVLPAVEPLGPRADAAHEMPPADHPLAELRALNKNELIALFT